MKPIPHRIARALAIAAATAALSVPPTAALAAAPEPTLQHQIDGYLAAHPGGTQINATEISYSQGKFVVTFGTRPNRAAAAAGPVADCPSGWFCFWDQPDYAGLRGRLSSCGWQDLATWDWNDRTMSAYYAMGSGSAQFLNHAAGTSAHTRDTVLFTISTSKRGLRLVPSPGMADHVNRIC
ncbi:peptidase inhibitor family I36 protein [Catellatospora aurea]|uniref:Peptidase inhibitor family I36 protein n=1 Tax=Catellatospora aurea TaxID=1337874 RepID=A0ABW2H225_9ACTN